MKHRTGVFILGAFRSDQASDASITAAEQLHHLLQLHGVNTITASNKTGRLSRLLDTIRAIILHRQQFSIAILPLYGTKPSVVWQAIAGRLLQLMNKKIILVVHGGSIPEQMRENANSFLKALNRADRVVAPSSFFNSFLKDYGIHSTVIENVLPINNYPFQDKFMFRPRIIWMRAFEDVYNPRMAIEVAKTLQAKFDDFKLVMAGGDKGLLTKIKALVRQYQLEHCIQFPGYINHQQKLQYAKDYDIYICTNTVDNAPVSVIEFMALGLPVVATNVGGIPYIIEDGVTGLLVANNDAHAMAEKIESIVTNPALGKQLALNAHQYSRRYDEVPVLKKWLALFDELEPDHE